MQSNIENTITYVKTELEYSMQKFTPFHSAHEGFAVILEELEELKEWVFKNQRRRSLPDMKREAIQLAAMATRFAIECCDGANKEMIKQENEA